ncbi:hypothetical protein AX16_008966 [Volvariella volvacea WC 439]|nr:hypothetical protein AX16_008966 [Volvariella volvacea WC 439]
MVQPRSPSELERMTFEMAARSDRTSTLPTLRRVARRVEHWCVAKPYSHIGISLAFDPNGSMVRLKPILDEIVILRDHTCNYRPTGESTKFVKHLWIEVIPNSDPTRAYDYISQCPNIQNLAMWSATPKAFSVITSAIFSPLRDPSSPPLTQLRIELKKFFAGFADSNGEIDFRHPILANVVTLEIVEDWSSPSDWKVGNNFGCMKKLRHLSFICEVCVEVVQNLLKYCENLEILAIWSGGDPDWWNKQLLKTQRVRHTGGDDVAPQEEDEPEDRVMVDVAAYDGMEEWRKGAEVGQGLWVRWCLAILEQRRAGRKILKDG